MLPTRTSDRGCDGLATNMLGPGYKSGSNGRRPSAAELQSRNIVNETAIQRKTFSFAVNRATPLRQSVGHIIQRRRNEPDIRRHGSVTIAE